MYSRTKSTGPSRASISYMAKFLTASTLRSVTNALSTILRLLGEESEEASWLIQVRSKMEPVEPCNEEW